jgi:hypothetical protein
VLLYDASNVPVAAGQPLRLVSGARSRSPRAATRSRWLTARPRPPIASANGSVCIYGLTVGAPGSGAGVELSTATLFAGGTVRLIGGTLS